MFHFKSPRGGKKVDNDDICDICLENFIDDAAPIIKIIMAGQSSTTKFFTKQDLKKWLRDNQPYYKKHIPDVVNYFLSKL